MKTTTSNTASSTAADDRIGTTNDPSKGAWLISRDPVATTGSLHTLWIDGRPVPLAVVDATPYGGTVIAADGRRFTLPDDPCANGSWGWDQLTPQTPPSNDAVASAILDAMNDFQENGRLNRHNPAIMSDGDGAVYYGSSIGRPEESILWDLQEGLGSWEPEPGDDFAALARGAAAAVVADLNASRE